MRANPFDPHKNAPGMRSGGFRSNREYYAHAGVDSTRYAETEEFPRLTHAPVVEHHIAPNWCNEYAQAVDTGHVMAGPHVRAACRRHIIDWERQWTPERPDSILWFDKGAYDHFAGFCYRFLRFYAGQFYGQPFELEAAQEFICGNIFGWRMWRTGYPEDRPWVWPRRFRRIYLEQGKGNGKTPLMGAIALYGLLADKEPGAEIYVGASKQKQAHVCFDDAVRMARASPVYEHLRVTGVSPPTRIDHLASESWVDLLSSESKNSESGIKPHIVLLDEIHEHKDGLLVDMMQRGFKWRRQPLLVMSTNSGWDMTSIAWEEHEHARKVSHGDIDSPESFGYVCAMDEGDDPIKDDALWPKANPLLGRAVQRDTLIQAVADAESYPTRVNNIRRLHFCQWTEGETAWISKDRWQSIEFHEEDHGWSRLLNRPVIAALDLADTGDLTGLSYVAPTSWTDEGKSIYTGYCRGYLPDAKLRERIDQDRRPYDRWAGLYPDLLHLIPGPIIDHDAVVATLLDDLEHLDVKALVYDAHRFDAFTRALTLMNFPTDIPLIEHPQGWNRPRGKPLAMSSSIGSLEKCIQARRIEVHVNPVLRAAVAGAVMQTSTTGQRKWNKDDAQRSRIDVLVALTMAIGAWEVGLDGLSESPRAATKKDHVRNFYRRYAQTGASLGGLAA